MTRTEALMTRARRLNPAPDDAFRGLAGSAEARETLDAILETPGPVRPAGTSRPRSTRRAPRTRSGLRVAVTRTATLATAAAVVVGVIAVTSSDRPQPSEGAGWSAELISIAQESPRLLVAKEGWSIVSAEEFSGETGYMTFATSPEAVFVDAGPGESWMSLNWHPAHMHADYVKDRRRGAEASWDVTIAGHEALLFQHEGTAPIGSTFYALWKEGGHSLELRSDVIPTFREFMAVASTVHVVDVDTWLSAMPASVVKPGERGDIVDEILADIPVPSNVDVEELKNRVTVSDDITYQVTDAVVCGWIKQWMDASESGHGAAKREAVEAMAGSRHWAVLQEDDQYRTVVFDIADAMATGSPINGDTSLPIGVGYQRHLGCPEG